MGFRIDQSYSDTGGTRHLSIVGNKIRIQETKSFWKDGKPTIQQSLPPQKPTKDKTATLSARDLTVLQSVVRSSGFFAAREGKMTGFCYPTTLEIEWDGKKKALHEWGGANPRPVLAYKSVSELLKKLQQIYLK
ncbi:MAG: hypothetical protein QM758_10335 [Armatimonas sp.]